MRRYVRVDVREDESQGNDISAIASSDTHEQSDISAPSDSPDSVQPRRSNRERRDPVWTKDYEMCMNTRVASEPDWKIRADYLKGLLQSELFSDTDRASLTSALLRIVLADK